MTRSEREPVWLKALADGISGFLTVLKLRGSVTIVAADPVLREARFLLTWEEAR